MNVETGELKQWSELTVEEKASGKWAELSDGLARRWETHTTIENAAHVQKELEKSIKLFMKEEV